jgi:hypothetical protein
MTTYHSEGPAVRRRSEDDVSGIGREVEVGVVRVIQTYVCSVSVAI